MFIPYNDNFMSSSSSSTNFDLMFIWLIHLHISAILRLWSADLLQSVKVLYFLPFENRNALLRMRFSTSLSLSFFAEATKCFPDLFITWHSREMFSIVSLAIFRDPQILDSAVVFLNIEDAFGDTMVVHSTDSCLNVHLISSALSSLTRNAALAISAHVPLSNIHPKLSRLFCSLRCLV